MELRYHGLSHKDFACKVTQTHHDYIHLLPTTKPEPGDCGGNTVIEVVNTQYYLCCLDGYLKLLW